MANNRPMTEDEKKLLQAQHRMEAIEARNRQKERKARTRRLIQMGAVLVSPSGSCALRGFAAPLEPYVQCHTCCHCPRSFRKYKRYCVCNQGYKLYPTLR